MVLVLLYTILSIVLFFSVTANVGIGDGLCMIGASTFALVSAPVLPECLARRVEFPIRTGALAVGLLAAAYAMSAYFSLRLFGYYVTGAQWAVAGAVLGWIFASGTMSKTAVEEP